MNKKYPNTLLPSEIQRPASKLPLSREFDFHSMIHDNLQLLKDCGRKINFEKGMFKERNLPGFENVGYNLLLIIDQTMCKKNIQWPLFDTTRKIEFRRKFTQCIKMINLKHADAQIPEINSSSLQAPGGSAFLNFMLKLSTFALKLELEHISGSDGSDYSLLKPSLKGYQKKDLEVFLSLNQKIRCEAEKKHHQYTSYLAEALPKLTEFSKTEDLLNDDIASIKNVMETSVMSLNLESELTERLLKINDDEVMGDWRVKTDARLVELDQAAGKLARLRELSDGCAKHLSSTRGQPPVLDANELLGERVSLVGLLQGGLEAVEALKAPSPGPSSPLLASAQQLLPDIELVQKRTLQASQRLHDLNDASQTIIADISPTVYEEARNTDMPACLDFLDIKISLSGIEQMTKDALRASSPSIFKIIKKERGLKRAAGPQGQNCRAHLVTSVKRRRSPGLYPPLHTAPRRSSFIASPSPRHGLLPPNPRRLSALISSPACRKSLYGRLPTGVKQHSEVSPVSEFGIKHLTENSFYSQYTRSSFIHNPFPSVWGGEELSGASGNSNSPFMETLKSSKLIEQPFKKGSVQSIGDHLREFTHRSFSSENSSLLANSDFSDMPEIKCSTLSENTKTDTDDSTSFSFLAPFPKHNSTKTPNNKDCANMSTPTEKIPPSNSSHRKSLDNIIKRYLKVKQSMQKSSKK